MVDETHDNEPETIESLESEPVGSSASVLAGLADLVEADEVGGAPADGASEGESDESSEAPAVRTDPVIGYLLRIALSLIVVLLATTGAVVYYLNTLNRAPRTSAERDIVTWETATIETPKNADAWSKLAYAYSVAGRYDEALDAVAEGAKRTKQPLLTLVKADILRSAGRFAEAKDAYDASEKAIADAERETDARREKLRVTLDIPDEAMARVYAGRAITSHELGDVDAAIKDLEGALKMMPQQSALWALVGDYYREDKRNDKAEEAYNNALQYVPDYEEALAGLKALGKEPK